MLEMNTETQELTDTVGVYGSQDLFLSQNSNKSSRSNASKKRQIEDFTWVQCDNLECQKWRKIPIKEAEGLGDVKWFCHMNSDPDHNTCASIEEDYAAYDRLAKRLGYKYVMSHLTVGTLVWAKMTGYCRWPAIVSKDPTCDLYYMVDNEGHPCRYHVEYLGKRHSRAWIPPKLIDLYGYRAEKEHITQNEKPTSCKKPKKKLKKKKMCLTSYKPGLNIKIRRTYARSPVEEAIAEAESLLPLSPGRRLKKCTFQPKSNPSTCKNEGKDSADVTTNHQSSCRECGQKYPKGRPPSGKGKLNKEKKSTGRPRKSEAIIYTYGQSSFCHVSKTSNTTVTTREPASQQMLKSCTEIDKNNNNITCTKSRACVPLDEKSAVSKFECAKLDMKSTMVDKSKEEKFRIDVEMYKKNEKAFDHDLFRFLERNKMKIKKKPVWHNTPIRLFELFLAVYERGGYLKVCQEWKWTAVYRELTNMGHGSAGSTARSFYEKYLYPYEVFVQGGDYMSVLNKIKSGQRPSDTSKRGVKRTASVSEMKEEVNTCSKEQEDLDFSREQSQESLDLEAMIEELDRSHNVLYLQEEIEETQRRLGISVNYHEDSPKKRSPGVATNASEPGMAFVPDEPAQLVPEVMFSSSEDSFQDNEVLLELQALENEFDSMDNQLLQLSY